MNQDELKQSLSEWMDSEASSEQSLFNYKRLKDSDEHRKSFEAFSAVGAVLRGESCEYWSRDFSAKVAAQIENEPVYNKTPHRQTAKQTFVGWAIAASVALAVVVGVQWQPTPNMNVGGEVAVQSEQAGTMLAEYHVSESERAQIEKIDTIFSQYAQSPQMNNDSSLPYVRLVSGEQVKTFRMTPKQFRQVMAELEKRNKEAELEALQQVNPTK